MRVVAVFFAVFVASGGCGDTTAPGSPAGPDAGVTTRHVALNLLFVHGVDTGAARAHAQDSLGALDAYVTTALADQVARYEALHPDVVISLESRRVNLYTDLDGNVLSPSIDAPSDGTGVPAATKWRSQLVAKLEQAYPRGEGNIILIGHSTGGRVAMEVTANVGANGQPGSFDWGVADRIAGVITLNGMLHDLQSSAFNFIGPLDFITGCQLEQERGWCEYAGLVSGVPAADAVTLAKHSLVLISAGDSSGDCSPSVWTGESDKVLPLLAEGCPTAPGSHATPSPSGQVLAPGTYYGTFCHSDTTDAASPRHQAAITASGDRMAGWIGELLPELPSSD